MWLEYTQGKLCCIKSQLNYTNKTLNEHDFCLSFELVTVMDQVVCTGRQLRFQILRENRSKTGINVTANNFYCVNETKMKRLFLTLNND